MGTYWVRRFYLVDAYGTQVLAASSAGNGCVALTCRPPPALCMPECCVAIGMTWAWCSRGSRHARALRRHRSNVFRAELAFGGTLFPSLDSLMSWLHSHLSPGALEPRA